MKTLKSIFAIAFLMICSLGFAQPSGNGQQQGPPPIPDDEQIEEMINSLAEELSLDDSQIEEITTIYTEHFKTITEKLSSDERPERSEMEALDKKLEKNVSALLTEDQATQYKAWLKEQASQRPQQK
jgi:hypothetical protein